MKLFLIFALIAAPSAFATETLVCSKAKFRCTKPETYGYNFFSYFSVDFERDGSAQVKGLAGAGRVEENGDRLEYFHGSNSEATVIVNLAEDGLYYGQASSEKEELADNGFSAYNYCEVRCVRK